jgi:outer membrane protein assembly factor BamD
MNHRPCFLVFSFVACCAFASPSPAAVIFGPTEKAKFHAPGEEEISGNAQELYNTAQAAEKDGNPKQAIKAYRTLLRKHPHDALAADSAYRLGQCFEQAHDYLRAAGAYANVAEKYPKSPHFDDSIEAMFRIGEAYLNAGKIRVLGIIKVNNTLDHAVQVFAYVVHLAPFGKYTARAQFDIGLAREKQGSNDLAVAAFQSVIDKFPDEPVAADAQYQIGYLWLSAARGGAKDPNASEQGKTAFQDFLFRYPKSEKAPQARENLRLLEHKQTSDSFGIAKFYDKQKNYRAAVIYYNDVLRQQPGSTEGDQAKRRIDQLRAKVGDAALQPRALTEATAKKKVVGMAQSTEARRSDLPAMRASPNDIAPLPPPESDISLPPPASLEPDTTLAPVASPTPTAIPEAPASPTPEPSATPEATASPAP